MVGWGVGSGKCSSWHPDAGAQSREPPSPLHCYLPVNHIEGIVWRINGLRSSLQEGAAGVVDAAEVG